MKINLNNIFKLMILLVWGIVVYLLYSNGLLMGDMNVINNFMSNLGGYKEIVFVAIAAVRIFAFIPSMIFMVLGGMLFGPVKSMGLVLLSLIISQSIIYVISNFLVGDNFKNFMIKKYPDIYKMMDYNGNKILMLSILTPIAPSDVASFFTALVGMRYVDFIKIVILANIPMLVLFSILGANLFMSLKVNLAILAVVAVIVIYMVRKWNVEKRNIKYA